MCGRKPSSESRCRGPLLRAAVFALGFSAVLTQLVLMREMLSAFAGNEIGLGILLGNWLLLMGAGTFAGRTATRLKNPVRVLAWAQFALALLPALTVFALRSLRNVVFVRGVESGIAETALGCFVLLLPYCVVSGYALTLACMAALADDKPTPLGTVYFWDGIGSIAGGALFSFVLIQFFSSFGVLAFALFLNLTAAVALGGTSLRLCGVFAGAAVAGVLAFADLDALSTRLHFGEAQVRFHGDSPYGRLVVTEDKGQFNFFQNGVPLFSTQDSQGVEERVHLAMAQRPNAKQVLLLSGGVSGAAQEVLKYGVARVDYVELDPLVVAAGRTFAPQNLQDARIRVVLDDARAFLRRTDERYDVVLIDVPEPATAQANRFYTVEFYRGVQRVLTPDGVVAFGLSAYDDYLSPELTRLIAVADGTLKSVYPNVLLIPGMRIYFIASAGALTTDIAGRMQQRGIEAQWVRPAYLASILTPDRMAAMTRALGPVAPLNEDFWPLLYYEHIRQWMAKYKTSFGALEVLLIALLLVYVLRLRALPLAIFSAGFAASALEFVLLLGFQVLLGSIYHQLALIVTAFMAGLAIGSAAGSRWPTLQPRRFVLALSFALALFAGALPLVLFWMTHSDPGAGVVKLAFSLLALLLAAAVGFQFTLAGRAQTDAHAASELYTADFVGACLGALLTSTALIPLLGVGQACLVVAAVNIAAGVSLVLRRV